MRRVGSVWIDQTVDAAACSSGGYSSLAFDGAGNAAIAYEADLGLKSVQVIHPGDKRYPMAKGIEAVPLKALFA